MVTNYMSGIELTQIDGAGDLVFQPEIAYI